LLDKDMLRAGVTDVGIYAAEEAESLMRVGAPEWESLDRAPGRRSTAETALSGVVSRLRLPPAYVSVARVDDSGSPPEQGAPLTRSKRLPRGEYLVRVHGPLRMDVRFEGAATVRKPGTGSAELLFSDSTEVTLEFDRESRPGDTVVVPRTPEGVARALTALAAGHRTDTSERSRPAMRGPPPRVAFADADDRADAAASVDDVEVPDPIADRRPPCEVTLRLPAELRYLFPAASLAYYLGAEVSVARGVTPTIHTPGNSVTLPSGRGFDRAVAEHLRRTFTLDCLVRTAGPYGADLEEARHLETLGLDAEALYDAPVAERFDAYLDAPFERVSEDLPEWHLAMYVAPEYEHVPTLARLVTNVPNLFLPRTEPLEGKERLTRALDDFYRHSDGGYEAASVDTVKPMLGPGRTHGWLAEEVPIDVFKTVPDVYERRRRDATRPADGGANDGGHGGTNDGGLGRATGRDGRDRLTVATVLNDAGMSREYEEAARIYGDHADREVTVSVSKHLTVDELRRIFESRHDLVHYIGHCDAAGLRCTDGHLSATDLRESNAEAFILNACGSYYEGIELVRKGSVAGAVTFEKVLDKHAARVGTAFARLLVQGFSIGRAMELARRRVIMGTDYSVVGDGTHALGRRGTDVPLVAWLARDDGGAYTLSYEASSPGTAGGWYRDPLPGTDSARLNGSTGEVTLAAAEVADVLDRLDLPVVYDGDIHWSDDLAASLE
jgi:hypothetical protein